VTLRGTADPGATVSVGAATTVAGPDGAWTLTVDLPVGASPVTVRATRDGRPATTITMTLNRDGVQVMATTTTTPVRRRSTPIAAPTTAPPAATTTAEPATTTTAVEVPTTSTTEPEPPTTPTTEVPPATTSTTGG
jgi:hypothetical protein